jgi:hypothetical protein
LSYPESSDSGSGRTTPDGARPASDAGPASSGDGGPAPGSRVWPTIIIVGLVIVVLVNIGFIYVAVSGQDEVVPSYLTEPR